MQRIRPLVAGAALLAGVILPAYGSRAAGTPAEAASTCPADRLSIAPVPGASNGGVGHLGFELSIRSLAQQTCVLYGYPGAQLVGANGHDLSTTLKWGGGYLYGTPLKRMVSLKTGATAYFAIEWVDNPTPGQTCPTAQYLLITPPNDRNTVVVPNVGIRACGGALTATAVQAKPLQ